GQGHVIGVACRRASVAAGARSGPGDRDRRRLRAPRGRSAQRGHGPVAVALHASARPGAASPGGAVVPCGHHRARGAVPQVTQSPRPLPSGLREAHPPTMPQTDLEILNASLGGSPLARAAIRGDSAVSAWYPAVPSEADAWRERASAASGRVAGDWLRALEPAVQASGAAAEKLDRVGREGGALVTTGQQPGLFGGPAYTWVKAVTAIALAAELEEAIGMPVAPLFWAATDDTDFEEASETWISGSDGAAHLALPPSLA